MREEEELQALQELQQVWDGLRSMAPGRPGRESGEAADTAPDEYRQLIGRAQILYGRTKHLIDQPFWTAFGRSTNSFQQVLGQPSLSGAASDPYWENSWGGCSSAIGQAIGQQEERIARLKERRAGVQATGGRQPPPAKVFIVHGHDTGVLNEVARLLQTLDIEPIILMEEPHRGRTLIEKLEFNSDVAYAVVLCTADDVGRANDEDDLKSRARQNVILELGYFIGAVDRQNVCVLMAEGLDMPTDVHGVGYHSLDPKGAWRFALAREMRAAGLSVDLNKLG